MFEKQPSPEKLNLILSVLTERKADAGHCKSFDNSLFASVGEKIYALEEIANHEEISRYFNTNKEYAESKKPKKRYIPDMSHPRKKDNFMKYVYAMVVQETDRAC